MMGYKRSVPDKFKVHNSAGEYAVHNLKVLPSFLFFLSSFYSAGLFLNPFGSTGLDKSLSASMDLTLHFDFANTITALGFAPSYFYFLQSCASAESKASYLSLLKNGGRTALEFFIYTKVFFCFGLSKPSTALANASVFLAASITYLLARFSIDSLIACNRNETEPSKKQDSEIAYYSQQCLAHSAQGAVMAALFFLSYQFTNLPLTRLLGSSEDNANQQALLAMATGIGSWLFLRAAGLQQVTEFAAQKAVGLFGMKLAVAEPSSSGVELFSLA